MSLWVESYKKFSNKASVASPAGSKNWHCSGADLVISMIAPKTFSLPQISLLTPIISAKPRDVLNYSSGFDELAILLHAGWANTFRSRSDAYFWQQTEAF